MKKLNLLTVGAFATLKDKKNTEINIKQYNEKLWLIYNSELKACYRITYSQFEKDIIGTTKYAELKEEFKRILGEQLDMKITTTFIPATIPGTADCILIEGTHIKREGEILNAY